MGLQAGQASYQTLAAGASPSIVSLDRAGGQMVSDSVGRYANLVQAGLVWLACNQAATALSLLNSTATGLILSNPAGSGKDLHLLRISVSLATAPAGAATLGLAANVNPVAAAVTHTTPLTVRNARLGASGTAVGLADGAATLPATPVMVRAIGGGPVAGSSISPAHIDVDLGGEIIVAPGCAVSLSSLTTAISVVASFIWAELAAAA